MANLTPIDTFSSVHQLETSDFVQGGAGGTANQQAQEAANRTEWLKNRRFPLGGVAYFAGQTTPINYLKCDGAGLLKASYPDLFAAINLGYGIFYVAQTIAGPIDYFENADSLPTLVDGDAVCIFDRDGNAPSGLTANGVFVYYAHKIVQGVTLHTSEADGITGDNPISFGTFTAGVSGCTMQLADYFNLPNIANLAAVHGSVAAYIAVK